MNVILKDIPDKTGWLLGCSHRENDIKPYILQCTILQKLEFFDGKLYPSIQHS